MNVVFSVFEHTEDSSFRFALGVTHGCVRTLHDVTSTHCRNRLVDSPEAAAKVNGGTIVGIVDIRPWRRMPQADEIDMDVRSISNNLVECLRMLRLEAKQQVAGLGFVVSDGRRTMRRERNTEFTRHGCRSIICRNALSCLKPERDRRQAERKRQMMRKWASANIARTDENHPLRLNERRVLIPAIAPHGEFRLMPEQPKSRPLAAEPICNVLFESVQH